MFVKALSLTVSFFKCFELSTILSSNTQSNSPTISQKLLKVISSKPSQWMSCIRRRPKSPFATSDSFFPQLSAKLKDLITSSQRALSIHICIISLRKGIVGFKTGLPFTSIRFAVRHGALLQCIIILFGKFDVLSVQNLFDERMYSPLEQCIYASFPRKYSRSFLRLTNLLLLIPYFLQPSERIQSSFSQQKVSGQSFKALKFVFLMTCLCSPILATVSNSTIPRSFVIFLVMSTVIRSSPCTKPIFQAIVSCGR